VNDLSATFDATDPDTGEVTTLPASVILLPGAGPTGLDLPDTLSRGQWEEIGQALRRAEKSVQWWIGDWLRYGERRWGETYTQAAQETGRSRGALRNMKSVADRFADKSRRRDDLDWTDHAEVASLDPETADALLEKAAREQLSTRDLRAEVAKIKGRDADISRELEQWLGQARRLRAAVGAGAYFVIVGETDAIDDAADLLGIIDPRRKEAA
jgi:hypothetical protein